MKKFAFLALCLLLVWFAFTRPDLVEEYNKTRRQLSAEATLRSQALTSAMEKYRLAAVLVVRSAIAQNIIRDDGYDRELLKDRIGFLQSLAGVDSVSVIRRDTGLRFPEFDVAPELVKSGQWRRALTHAFQGSLGRAFYNHADNTPYYIFIAPYFETGQAPKAAIVVSINLSLLRDSWDVSGNRIELVDKQGQLMFANNVAAAKRAIVVERAQNQLNATLRVSGKPPPLFGGWWLRSILIGTTLIIAGLLLSRQFERRRFLAELSLQQATEAARLEAEVNQRTEELKQAQSQLLQTEKLALLGQMSASISHEINQPLAALKNYASTADKLLETNRPEAARDNLQLISKLTDRVSRIVVNLRSFAINEPSSVQAVSTAEVIEEAIAELLDRFPQAEHAIHFENRLPVERAFALAGRIRLLQVLGNLLTNAWYACRQNDNPWIHLKLSAYDDKQLISIADNGPGFNEEMSTSAFDAFVSSRDSKSGLGLGLSISRSFLESMNGTLELESNSEDGAILLISLNHAGGFMND